MTDKAEHALSIAARIRALHPMGRVRPNAIDVVAALIADQLGRACQNDEELFAHLDKMEKRAPNLFFGETMKSLKLLSQTPPPPSAIPPRRRQPQSC